MRIQVENKPHDHSLLSVLCCRRSHVHFTRVNREKAIRDAERFPKSGGPDHDNLQQKTSSPHPMLRADGPFVDKKQCELRLACRVRTYVPKISGLHLHQYL